MSSHYGKTIAFKSVPPVSDRRIIFAVGGVADRGERVLVFDNQLLAE
jgi:hypothetical protein